MTDCYLTFSDPVSKQTIHSLVVDIIDYVLFYRGQIPCLLNQKSNLSQLKFNDESISQNQPFLDQSNITEFGNILVYTDNVNKSNQLKGTTSRTEQLYKESVSKFDTFFKDLLCLLQCNHVLEVVLKLGSTFPSPEIYHIKLPTKCENAECNEDSVPIHRWRSRVYQALFRSNLISDFIEKPLPISVMLHLLPGSELANNVEYKKFYKIPKTSKCKLVSFNCCCRHIPEHSSEDTLNVEINHSTLNNIDNTTTNSSLWVLIKPELKGIPKRKS